MAGPRAVAPLLVVLTLAACASGPPRPAALEAGRETCASCRMVVSDARFAAQLVAPGEEPLFFDDVGCLKTYLASRPPGSDAALFVADHRTKDWIAARQAVFTRVPTLDTPMGSHVFAHADAVSRDRDPAAAAGSAVAATEILGPLARSGEAP